MNPNIIPLVTNVAFACEHLIWKRGKQIEGYKQTKEHDQLKGVIALVGSLWNSDSRYGNKHLEDSMTDDRVFWTWLSNCGITMETSELITGVLEEIRLGAQEIARHKSEKRDHIYKLMKKIGI